MVNIKRTITITLILLFVILLVCPSVSIAQNQAIFDEANLFTQSEINKLEDQAINLSSDYNIDIVIVTTDDSMGKSSRAFADDFFDYGGFGQGTDKDGILFLIDMDNREAYISTSGIGTRYLTDNRIESVLDSVFDNGLSSGDYYGAALGFLKETKLYLEEGIPSDQYNEPEADRPKNRLTIMDFIISLLGGSITGGVFYFRSKSNYKTKKQYNPYSYRSNSFVEMGTMENKLINSYVTHRIIPSNTYNNPTSTSGRSSTHRSSSGRTHGGGGRKF